MMRKLFLLFPLWVVFILSSCTIRDKQPAALSVSSSPYDTAYNLIKEAELSVKEGDLVLRDGQEFSSQLIKNFNRIDKTFSHAGLVFYKNGYPYVWHIVPEDENPGEKMRIDSLRIFCNPRKNFGVAIYRYDMSQEEIASLKTAVAQWQVKGVSFDSTFNLKTDDKMYCSEMIKKGLAKATANRITISTTKPDKSEAQFFSTHLRLPISYTTNLEVVAIDNLFINPYCKEVRRFNFNPTK